MHTKLPFATALILVLAPSALCILFGVVYHLLAGRRSARENNDLSARISQPSHRRDDVQSILLILGIAVLALTFSTAA